MRVVCLSRNGANRLSTTSLLPNATLVVPETQYEDYLKSHSKSSLVCMPDSNSEAESRNWIRENFDDDWLIMLVDDIESLRRVYVGKDGQETRISDEGLVMEILSRTCDSAEAAGCKLFGFSESHKTMDFDLYNPIKLSGYVSAHAFGIRKDCEVKFQHDFLEGHWLSAMNAFLHRKAWIDTRFCFKRSSTPRRTVSTKQWETLEKAFGRSVVSRTNPREPSKINIPI